jgi:trans-aconitate methyltransferase
MCGCWWGRWFGWGECLHPPPVGESRPRYRQVRGNAAIRRPVKAVFTPGVIEVLVDNVEVLVFEQAYAEALAGWSAIVQGCKAHSARPALADLTTRFDTRATGATRRSDRARRPDGSDS